MTTFLAELGRKLAEKWLTLLVLPGVLLVAAIGIAGILGQRSWADTGRLTSTVTDQVNRASHQGGAAVGLVVVAVLLAAACAGLAATATGHLVRYCWLGLWPAGARPVSNPLTARRTRRWDQLDRRLTEESRRVPADQDILDRLAARRGRIALARPSRPTWIGDRMAAVDARVLEAYDLDLTFAWPRLWLVLPETARAELQAAAAAFDGATTLGGWGMLYLVLGTVWWPAGVLGAVVLCTAWRRGRATATVLAALAESAVDVYGKDLAAALGIGPDSTPFDPAAGQRIRSLLRKGA